MRAEARVPSQCAACRKQGHLQIVQEIRDGQLKWTESFSCDCGHGFETGNTGLPAPGLRNALLKQAGTARVWLDQPQGRGAAGKLLEAVLGATAAQVAEQLKVLPARVYEGTPTEAAFIAAALEAMGVKQGVRVETQTPA